MAALSGSLLVLGAGGQLGHVVASYFLSVFPGNVFLQARRTTGIGRLDKHLTLRDARNTQVILEWIDTLGPVVIVNCIGRKLSHGEMADDDLTYLNSEFPRLLAAHLDAKADGSRLIHISSDGVFNGRRGSYSELDIPDADDPYGRSKIDGEIWHGCHLTVRTSFVGHSLSSRSGLLDWLLAAKGPVHGYSQVFWNGVSSLELAKFLAYAVQTRLSGLVHFGGERISKYTLLALMATVYEKRIEIIPRENPGSDRSLCSIRGDIRPAVPKMEAMLRDYRRWYEEQFRISV